MDQMDIEHKAKKYKKLLEKQTVIHFQLMEGGRKWWMVEYSLKPGLAKGFALLAEGDTGRGEKISALDHFISTLRTIISIQTIIVPRIAVTEEIEDILGKMRKGLATWKKNGHEERLASQFSGFSELILWYQGMVNDVYQEYQIIGKQMDENHIFTPEIREMLSLIGSKLDLLVYLQVKLQYDQLEANRELLKSLQKNRNGLEKQEYSFLLSSLKRYCDYRTEKGFESTLFNEDESIWRNEIVTKGSYERLLDSSIQKYREIDERRLRDTIPMLRN